MTEVEEYNHKAKKVIKRAQRNNPTIAQRELMRLREDPTISRYHPLKFFGSISEKMDDKLGNYLKNDCMSKVIEK